MVYSYDKMGRLNESKCKVNDFFTGVCNTRLQPISAQKTLQNQYVTKGTFVILSFNSIYSIELNPWIEFDKVRSSSIEIPFDFVPLTTLGENQQFYVEEETQNYFFFSRVLRFWNNNKNYIKSVLRMEKKHRFPLDIVPARIRKIITPYHTFFNLL